MSSPRPRAPHPRRLCSDVWKAGRIECGAARVPRTADCIVVGGGVMGLSIALHAARSGSQVVLLEQECIGYGASGRNAGLYLPSMARLESIDHLHAFAERDGGSLEFETRGHLALALNPEIIEAFGTEARRPGSPVSLLDPAATREAFGAALGRHVLGARWYANGGVINPWRFLTRLVDAGKRTGVVFLEKWRVESIEAHLGGVQVHGRRGTISAGWLFIAAGAWTRKLLPPLARWMSVRPAQMVAARLAQRSAERPGMAVGFGQVYWRETPQGVVVAGGRSDLDRRSARSGNPCCNPRSHEAILSDLAAISPRYRDLQACHVWAGGLDVTADGRPMVGQAGDNARVWLASGFGGHGLPPALGVGAYITNLALALSAQTPDDRLDPRRFAVGGLRSLARPTSVTPAVHRQQRAASTQQP
jgi:sarcosine oxidase subunit beta